MRVQPFETPGRELKSEFDEYVERFLDYQESLKDDEARREETVVDYVLAHEHDLYEVRPDFTIFRTEHRLTKVLTRDGVEFSDKLVADWTPWFSKAP